MTIPISTLAQKIENQFSALVNRLSQLPDEYLSSVSSEIEQFSTDLDYFLTTCEEQCQKVGSTPSTGVIKIIDQNLQLETERDRLKALVESMTDEVWYCDPEGNVTMMNDRIVQNLGLENVEELNLTIHDIVTKKLEIYRPDGTPRPEEEAPQYRSLKGETVRGQEMIRNLRTHELRYREYASAPIRSSTGEVIGAVGLARDITDLRQMEAREREYTAQMEVQRGLLEHREMERQELARNLHDGPIQSLGGLGFSLQIVQNITQEEEVKAMLHKMSAEVKSLISELRGVCNELRPPILTRFGLKQAIEEHAADFQQKHPEIQLHVECPEEPTPLVDKLTLALYRIYQEGLTNILRHAQASEIWVNIAYSTRHIVFEMRDNGQGFELPQNWIELARGNHFGLVGMKERAEAVKGTFHIFTQPGGGTMIQVMVPLND